MSDKKLNKGTVLLLGCVLFSREAGLQMPVIEGRESAKLKVQIMMKLVIM